MSNVLVTSHPSPGHFNPVFRIAQYLHCQRHNVTILNAEIFRSQVEEAGIKFLPFEGVANHDYRERTKLFPELDTDDPFPQQLNAYMQFCSRMLPSQYASVQKVLKTQPVDVVIADLISMGAFALLLQPPEMRPPVITIGVVAPVFSVAENSPFNGYDSSAEGLKRNAEHWKQYWELLTPGSKFVDDALNELGLKVQGGFTMDSLYTVPETFLQLSTEEFELPTNRKLTNMRFIGPLAPKVHEEKEIPEWVAQLDTSKPVVMVSQGGIANRDFSQLVLPAIDALKREDVEIVATGGGKDLGAVATNPRVHLEPYIPYELIFPKASVFLTNGGFNGVQEALSHGVPVIVAGTTEDKPLVAARVVHSGAGLSLGTNRPSQKQIREAVQTILGDPRYRQSAQELQKSFVRYDAPRTVEKMIAKVQAGWKRK